MSTTPAVLAGAEPIDLAGGPVGVVLSHGFTGTTQSMRPWAKALHDAGLSVRAPRLPGHGTTVADLGTTRFSDWYGEVERSFDDLRTRCEQVFVMGLSMGGTLALRLAEERAGEVDGVAGVVVVNASLRTDRADAKLLPLLSKVIGPYKGVGSDIKKPGVTELAYPKIHLKAALSLQQAWPVVRADLGRITAPVLSLRSAVDHVVEASSGAALLAGVPHATEVVLPDSYHVATLDNDFPTVVEQSLTFVRTHSTVPLA